MPKLTPEQQIVISNAIKFLRVSHADIIELETETRTICDVVSPQYVRQYIAVLERYFGTNKEMAKLLKDHQDDPLSQELLQLYEENLRQRDEVLGFWRQKLNQSLN